MTKHPFTITTARGMLPLLEKELMQLGLRSIKREKGHIRLLGTLEDAYRVCLWSRIAIRVLLPIAHFSARTTDELYAAIADLPWEDHIEAQDSTIAVDFNSVRSKIHHSQFGAQRVKDAIVDRFRQQTGQRPSVDLFQPDLRVNVYLKNNHGVVSIDLSGESLHKRGYRVKTTEAPLKEHLAAAILMLADWPEIAKRGDGLLDPMCGSGTLLVEAAMMAADIAPGIYRDYFGFLYWKQHDRSAWTRVKAEAERRRYSGLARLPRIIGGDRDKIAVEAAMANIQEAGFSDRIQVVHTDIRDWSARADRLPDTGLLVCNPPYGERMGDAWTLHQIYEHLGTLIRDTLPGWRMTLITDNEKMGQYTGLTLQEQTPLDNGPIACQVMRYHAPRRISSKTRPHSRHPDTEPTTPAFSRDLKQETALSAQAEMFANRLKKNLKHLGKWARKNQIECYRLYDADLPDYAMAIDIYGDHVHIQEYAPPPSIDAEKAVQRLNEAMQIIPAILHIPASHVVLKLRKKQRGTQQYEAQAALNHRFIVTEAGLKFWVNLTDYLDTGLFLDHRITRGRLAELAAGHAFLNLFAYTGTATVYAAAAGAESTTTVDMSNTYLRWAKENMDLNHLMAEKHRFVRANCLEWLEEAQHAPQRYGVIFLDPPTFSNSSRMDGVFDVQRDHAALIHQTANLLTRQGTLIFSTNRRDFKLDPSVLAQYDIKDISRATLPKDFERNPKIHYCWQIRRRAL